MATSTVRITLTDLPEVQRELERLRDIEAAAREYRSWERTPFSFDRDEDAHTEQGNVLRKRIDAALERQP